MSILSLATSTLSACSACLIVLLLTCQCCLSNSRLVYGASEALCMSSDSFTTLPLSLHASATSNVCSMNSSRIAVDVHDRDFLHKQARRFNVRNRVDGGCSTL